MHLLPLCGSPRLYSVLEWIFPFDFRLLCKTVFVLFVCTHDVRVCVCVCVCLYRRARCSYLLPCHYRDKPGPLKITPSRTTTRMDGGNSSETLLAPVIPKNDITHAVLFLLHIISVHTSFLVSVLQWLFLGYFFVAINCFF